MLLQLMFAPGTNIKKAASVVSTLASRGDLRAHNYAWLDKTQYEHEVSPLQRFLVDASVSGGGGPASLLWRAV